MADKRIFWSKTALTGGAAGALDSIDGTALQDGEVAHVFISDILYVYRLDVDSAAAESSPNIIAPDTNPGDKRWILQGLNGASLNMPGLTASRPVFTDGSKNLVSNTMTGTGKVVMDTSPTLVTPDIGAATATSITTAALSVTALSNGKIPYHVSDASGLADGPTKTDVDSAVSLKHAALTIDGTSPLSLSGQAISLKNDADAAITEVDTGTLANSDTVVPTSKAVKAYADGKATLAEVKADADISSAISLKHAAVTIDGTSPLSLSGQAISLQNDAAAAITEVDTGTLADSDTAVPTSKAVKTYVGSLIGTPASDAILSGTPKVFVLYDGATPYYIKGYPTKS